MPNAELEKTELKLVLISGHAQRDASMQFTSLAHLLNVSMLRECFYSLNRNKAKGIDNVSWSEYSQNLEENLSNLVGKLKAKKYKPLPARRVYIPKADGRERPIGISAIENKIVEKGIKVILESIYEHDFIDNSYGFRPKRSCHQALREIHDQFSKHPINHVVEADIKGFFDNVSHELLMKALETRIKDASMLLLIKKFLKAGYVDKDMIATSDEGTPQGSILSPLLANIFLHYVLDRWFIKQVKAKARGYCEMVRYADDFVCLVQYEDVAKKIEFALAERFKYCKLELHPDKSRRLSFGRYAVQNAKDTCRPANTFDFLGITHYCDKTRNSYFKLGRKTIRKRFSAKCKIMTSYLKGVRNTAQPKEWWKTLSAKLRGHYQYYGISENSKGIQAFYSHTIRMLFKWLNRRSQKRSMNWEGFNKYLEKYKLPLPRITHNFYAVSRSMELC